MVPISGALFCQFFCSLPLVWCANWGGGGAAVPMLKSYGCVRHVLLRVMMSLCHRMKPGDEIIVLAEDDNTYAQQGGVGLVQAAWGAHTGCMAGILGQIREGWSILLILPQLNTG